MSPSIFRSGASLASPSPLRRKHGLRSGAADKPLQGLGVLSDLVLGAADEPRGHLIGKSHLVSDPRFCRVGLVCAHLFAQLVDLRFQTADAARKLFGLFGFLGEALLETVVVGVFLPDGCALPLQSALNRLVKRFLRGDRCKLCHNESSVYTLRRGSFVNRTCVRIEHDLSVRDPLPDLRFLEFVNAPARQHGAVQNGNIHALLDGPVAEAAVGADRAVLAAGGRLRKAGLPAVA